MAERVVHSEGASIVLIGEFNSAQFSPKWFFESGLVSSEQLIAADIQIFAPQTSFFELGWLRIEVIPTRLSLVTTEPEEYIRLRDTCANLLRLRDETNVKALGMNRFTHLNMQNDRKAWHDIGDALVPKDPFWVESLSLPGMASLYVQGTRTDEYAGHELYSVQNSNVVRPGLYIEHNDHYSLHKLTEPVQDRDDPRFYEADDLGDTSQADRLEFALAILGENWDQSMAALDTFVGRLLGLSGR
jgi:hypothetical protein